MLNFSRSALFLIKTRVCVKYFLNNCRAIYTCPCYFGTPVANKHVGLTCQNDLAQVIENVEEHATLSVRSKNVCMIASNIYRVIQLVSFKNFDCQHKEVFFACKQKIKVNASVENASRNMQKTSFIFYLTFHFRCLQYLIVVVFSILLVKCTMNKKVSLTFFLNAEK